MTPAKVALRRGLGAFVVVALAGQLIPIVIDLFGGGLSFPTARAVGWFYTLAFHHVAIDVATSATTSRLSIAFLSGTALVLWLLYRGGRAAGRHAGPSLRERMLAGAMIAPVYAAPIVLVTLFTHLQLRTGGGILHDVVRVQGVVWQAIVFPAVLAIVAGGAGGMLVGEPSASRLRAWLVGGWRMLLMALGLALICVLVLAAVRPEGLRSYVHTISADGSRGAMLILGHHALLLPNQSFMVLAPSMGGCLSFEGPVATVPLVCPGRLPVLGGEVSVTIRSASRGGPSPAHRRMPAAYWLFVLIPAVATVVGGRWAAGDVLGRERWIRSAGAGVVFGVLVGCGAWVSGVGFRAFWFGAAPLATGLLGLAWGTLGGLVGALWRMDQGEPGTLEPVPPNPTSV